MIHWSLQPASSVLELAYGQAPSGLLSVWEADRLQAFKNIKRRREWLLGRWTTKTLLRSSIQEMFDLLPPLDIIEIRNDPLGVPFAILRLGATNWDLPFHLSISHSEAYAFCAVRQKTEGAIGVDIERIEKRISGFADAYFSQGEVEALEAVSSSRRELLITAIWSAKEAALKAAGLGLTMDTRAVTCRLEIERLKEQVWAPFQIDWDHQRLHMDGGPSHLSSEENFLPNLKGLWRVFDRYVMTLAVQS